MARDARYYDPEERRYVENNLFCPFCGNSNAFSIDLKLRHKVECQSGLLNVGLDKRVKKVLHAIENNLWRIVDKGLNEGKSVIRCANCENKEWIDLQERMLDWCWQLGCPGCWYCGNWIEKDNLIELCSECIISRGGNITDDDCSSVCPHYDDGLEQVMDHYGITLDRLKMELGYP
ncbi:MAG: hypothetical protein V3U24_10705 [Candidatus Neomarinimicrobiota bacterium]